MLPARIYEHLRARPNKEFRACDIARALFGKDYEPRIDLQRVCTTLGLLYRRGLIERPQRGVYTYRSNRK